MSTTIATNRAPDEWKVIGIQAGASSNTQVTRPGPASKRRAPNWRNACSQAGAGGWASITATIRLWLGNRDQPRNLAFTEDNLQDFHGPKFEADVLESVDPDVIGLS